MRTVILYENMHLTGCESCVLSCEYRVSLGSHFAEAKVESYTETVRFFTEASNK